MSRDVVEDLLIAEEVGEMLRLKASTVYQAAADGRIPCIRLWEGRRRPVVRFRRSDIDTLLRDRTVTIRPTDSR